MKSILISSFKEYIIVNKTFYYIHFILQVFFLYFQQLSSSLKGLRAKMAILIWSIMRKICSFLYVKSIDNSFLFSCSRNAQITIEINTFQLFKHGYLIHTWSDQACTSTVVNWTKPSFHGGHTKLRVCPFKKMKNKG